MSTKVFPPVHPPGNPPALPQFPASSYYSLGLGFLHFLCLVDPTQTLWLYSNVQFLENLLSLENLLVLETGSVTFVLPTQCTRTFLLLN